MPENIIKTVYVSYALQAQEETTFQFGANSSLSLTDIEVNIITKSVLYFSTCRSVVVTNLHLEHIAMTTNYGALILVTRSNLAIIGGDATSSTSSGLTVANSGYLILNYNNILDGTYGNISVSTFTEDIAVVSGALSFVKCTGVGDHSSNLDQITRTNGGLWPSGDTFTQNSIYNYDGQDLRMPTFTDTDVTPDVTGIKKWKTGNTTGATNITDFDGTLYPGQELIILGADAGNSTIKHDIAKINMVGAADFTPGDGDVLHLIYDGTDWCEISRADNTVA